LSGAHTLSTANTTTAFSAGSLTTSTYGTIFFNRYNYLTPGGGGVGTIDLSVNYAINFTNNNLRLTALGAYNTIWTKANAQINGGLYVGCSCHYLTNKYFLFHPLKI
jgi:hypothetical protein